MRFAWDLTFDYLRKLGRGPQGYLTRYLLHQMRQWDVLTANRVDYFANQQKHSSPHLALLPPPSNVFTASQYRAISLLTSKQDFTSPFPGW